MNIAQAILQLHPAADPLVDFRVEDAGAGPELVAWNLPCDRPTDEELGAAWVAYQDATRWDAVRAQRAPLLAEADVAINKAEDLDQPTAALRSYRQALRDITTQDSPETCVWPTRPW